MKILDLCCGLGGWSKGFAAEGFTPTGVDIINVGYPYEFILSDIKDFSSKEYYDVVVASPPCRDFSRMCRVAKVRKWKKQPDPEAAMELVNNCFRVINEIKPRYWLVENVPGILKRTNRKPACIVKLTPTMKRVFFGEFPPFLIPLTKRGRIMDISGPLRAWKRAEIPFAVANSFAKTIKGLRG